MPPYAWQQWQAAPIDPALLMAQQAPPGPPLGLLGMLSPADVQNIPMQTQAPMPSAAPAPYAPKPSIVDRVLGRLFPTPSGLDPAAAHQLQRQGLLQVGTSLMRSGGAAPYQRGTLANIGGAIGGVDLSGMVNNALAVQAYQKQQADQAKQEAFLSSIKPPMPGQDFQGWIESVASQPDALRYPAQVKNLLELHQLLQDKKGAGDWQPYANQVSGEMYRFNKRTGKLEPAGAVGQSKLLGPAAKPSLTPAELAAAHQV